MFASNHDNEILFYEDLDLLDVVNELKDTRPNIQMAQICLLTSS